jgi:hypothetical protein
MRHISLFAVLLSFAAGNSSGTWNDTPGDAGGAPDITQVSATTADGTLSFTIRTASASDWEGAVAFVLLDTVPGAGDANGTDQQLTLHSLHDLITHERWNGQGWELVSPSQAAFSLSGSTLTLSVPLAELGSPVQIGLVVETRGTAGGDNAPDVGRWHISTAAPVRFTPAQPVHGRVFSASGAAKCKAKLRGRPLAGTCRWKIPANARGASLVVVADGRTYRFRVR